MGHYEKTKSKKNGTRGKRRCPDPRHRKYFPQNHRRKFPSLMKEMLINVQETYKTPSKLDMKKIPQNI